MTNLDFHEMAIPLACHIFHHVSFIQYQALCRQLLEELAILELTDTHIVAVATAIQCKLDMRPGKDRGRINKVCVRERESSQ